MPLVTVAERLKPERLYDEFVAYRSTLGMEILPLTGGDAALPAAGGNGCAAGGWCACSPTATSRAPASRSSCAAARARMPRGPALLARRTGAPLVPATLHYAGDDMAITFHAAGARTPKATTAWSR